MSQLPTGTLTMLFLDLEGSTRLLQQLGSKYASLLSQMRRILRAVFQQHHGHEVDTQGDSFFLVFQGAKDALLAAAAMQQGLARASWPEGARVQVRMGIHTGEPMLTPDGYIGVEVHHTARIMGAGHGGQILLSEVTCELVSTALPDEMNLRDLGEHLLKDLPHPIRLFQLIGPGLPDDFPPLKTLDPPPHTLPVQPTPFYGREQELELVLRLFRQQDARLITVTGFPGVGKTRLALQAAQALRDRFADGITLIPLETVSAPAMVVPALLQGLSISDASRHAPLEVLISKLKNKQMLLILDNFEQVQAASVDIADLITACERLKFLVTSRVALHVRAEQELLLSPMPLPDLHHLPELAELSQQATIALLMNRIQAVNVRFQVTAENAPILAAICARLDGIPLALELVAARMKVFSPEAVLSRLDHSLALLTDGARDLPERHQTLRGALAWSYHLLSERGKALFRRAAIFSDGWTLDAAEQICMAAGRLSGEVSVGLTSLVDKSLIQDILEGEGEPRFRMLQTVREFGLERLAEANEEGETRAAHAGWFVALAEQAEPHLRGAEQSRWLKRLEQEHENLRLALSWMMEQARQGAQEPVTQALRFCDLLFWFWYIRGYAREGQNYLQQALFVRHQAPPLLQAKTLINAAQLALITGHPEQAEALGEEGMTLYRELDNLPGKAAALDLLASIAWSRCHFVHAKAQLEEAAAIFQQLGDTWEWGRCLTQLARIATIQGDYSLAEVLLQTSLKLYRAMDDRVRIGWTLYLLARVSFLSHRDLRRAVELSEQSLVTMRELGGSRLSGSVLALLGQLYLEQGELEQARAVLEESRKLFEEVGYGGEGAECQIGLARLAALQGRLIEAQHCYQENITHLHIDLKDLIAGRLEGLAEVMAAQGKLEEAARLWGAAEALREAIGAPMPLIYQARYRETVSRVRAALGEAASADAWSQGRAQPLEEVLAALEPGYMVIPHAPAPPSVLSRRPPLSP